MRSVSAAGFTSTTPRAIVSYRRTIARDSRALRSGPRPGRQDDLGRRDLRALDLAELSRAISHGEMILVAVFEDPDDVGEATAGQMHPDGYPAADVIA
jgi:hypothetical protein